MTTHELLSEIDGRIEELEQKESKTRNSIHFLRSVRDLASGHSDSFSGGRGSADEEDSSGDHFEVLLERVVMVERRSLARKGRCRETSDRVFLRKLALQRQCT